MIGNLFLALGLACLSASAVSTDNFQHVDNSLNQANYVTVFNRQNGYVNFATYDGTSVYQNAYNEYVLTLNGSTQQNYVYCFGVDKDGVLFKTSYQSEISYSLQSVIQYFQNNGIVQGGVISGYTYNFGGSDIFYYAFMPYSRLKMYDFDNGENVVQFFSDSLSFNFQYLGQGATRMPVLVNCAIPSINQFAFNELSTSITTNTKYYINSDYSISDLDDIGYVGLDKTILLPYTGQFRLHLRSFHWVETTYSQGYADGYNNGYSTGLTEGYSNGYAEGLRVGSGANADVKNLFGVLADTPIRFLKDMFNFELFGMNVAVVILSCLTAICMFALIKKIWK